MSVYLNRLIFKRVGCSCFPAARMNLFLMNWFKWFGALGWIKSSPLLRCHLWRGRVCVFGAQRRSAFERRTGNLGDRKPSFEVSVHIQLVLFINSAFWHKRGLYSNRSDLMLARRITCVQIYWTAGKRRAWFNGIFELVLLFPYNYFICTSVKYGGFRLS